MARIHSVIEVLLGAQVSEADIREAFQLEHDDFKSHPMVAEQRGGILIHGDFNTTSVQCAYVGHFERYIYQAGTDIVAEHRNIFILPPYRKQKIAKNHLAKLLPFYDRVGIEYIHLQAVDYGPPVWPQLGFEIREPHEAKLVREKFRSIVADLGYTVDPPDRTARLATAPAIDGVAVGVEALRRTYEEDLNCEHISMILDLKDLKTREYLRGRGIILCQPEEENA